MAKAQVTAVRRNPVEDIDRALKALEVVNEYPSGNRHEDAALTRLRRLKAVYLYYSENWTQQDIAEDLGVSQQAVSKYLADMHSDIEWFRSGRVV